MKKATKSQVEKLSLEDSPTGDICNDLLNDKNFPWAGTVKQQKDYLNFHVGIDDVVDNFFDDISTLSKITNK